MRHVEATRSATQPDVASVAVSEQDVNVRIAGVGLLTPLGATAATSWDALLRGDHIANHSRVPVDFKPGECRATALALRAAGEAVECARWPCERDDNGRTAVLVGTSKGPVESWLAPPLHMSEWQYVVGGLTGEGIGGIAAAIGHEFQITGPRLTLSAACASGLHALIRAAMMLRGAEADRALVVAAESSLHPLFEGSFRRLGVLAKPGIGCRPFDENRDGFLMSESAAAVCLEADRGESTEPIPPGAVCLDRFALGGDATHLTGSDPNGATLRRLITQVIGAHCIDLVHAHGTGTVANDAVEASAIESCLNAGEPPALYSHKGALGHSLGAAGLVSVVLNCLMHRHGVVLPNVQAGRPLPMRKLILSQAPLRRDVTRSIAIAAGFGGPMAVIGLTTP